MKKVFTLNKLSMDFYSAYPANMYPEIEYKPSRPYVVMVVEINGNRFALPFRTNIRHNYCYKFRNSSRETDSNTGIDFTKAVIVNNTNYIGVETTIDNMEYTELSKKYISIISSFNRYLNGYIEFCLSGANEDKNKKYKFTTLKYFHKELNICM